MTIQENISNKTHDQIKLPSSNFRRGSRGAVRNFIFVILVFTIGVNARATLDYFYAPEHVGNIAGRVYMDSGSPVRTLNMSTFGCGTYSEVISGWQVGDFSGVISPNPLGDYQVGLDNSQYGSTAIQMTDIEMGGQLHTYSILGGSGYNYDLANLQVKYSWEDSDNILPWTRPTSKLRFAFNLKVPLAYMQGGAVGYVYSSLLLKDQTGKIFWFQTLIYDTRGAPSSEYLGWDTGTSSGFVNTFYDYNNSRRYCSKNPASYWSTGTTWGGWRWYDFTISRAQLLNAINDMNSTYGSGLSTNVAGYRVEMFSVQDEIYWPTGNGHLSMGVRDIIMADEY